MNRSGISPWNSPRSCPAGYNGTVTFACNDNVLSLNRGKCGARCDAGAYELMNDLSLDYPDAGLHWKCKKVCQTEWQWLNHVESTIASWKNKWNQVEFSTPWLSNARCPDGHVGTWRDYDSRTYAAAVVKGQILSCDIHLEWTRQLDNWINLYKSGIYNWIWYTYGS